MVQTFAERTGFDPFTQVDRVTVAFPENARDKDTFAVLLAAHGLDANRLIAYIRERLAEKGDDLTSGKQAGFLTWTTHQPPILEGAFLAKDEVVVGAGGFPRAIMERRAASPSTAPSTAPPAALEPELAALIGALGVHHEVWGAAVVPASTRERLLGEPRFHAAASVRRLGLAVDLDPELDATVLADLGSDADAAALAREAQQAVQRAKADPKLLLLGLPSFLERVTVANQGPRFSLTLRLDPQKTRELLGRVASWSALASTPRPPPPPGFP